MVLLVSWGLVEWMVPFQASKASFGPPYLSSLFPVPSISVVPPSQVQLCACLLGDMICLLGIMIACLSLARLFATVVLACIYPSRCLYAERHETSTLSLGACNRLLIVDEVPMQCKKATHGWKSLQLNAKTLICNQPRLTRTEFQQYLGHWWNPLPSPMPSAPSVSPLKLCVRLSHSATLNGFVLES